ncbi:sodium- and chloride-dependent GABA transporter 1-like [Liolophura sinensis]|uniref:sodium- and chloride-dependent GABA transporter 1-like n=1 Tax=Liolophura sinensis TaxID=3198878 RepID=UPI0031583A99
MTGTLRIPDANRGQWGRSIEFVLSSIGYVVGMGCIWRFPYMCMRNGGGAFLIPYFLFLFICGIPMFFMEAALGQYLSLSPLQIWKICPLFKGLGLASTVLTSIYALYNNTIMAWVMYYIAMTFRAELPWGSCDNDWNTENCITEDLLSKNDSMFTNASMYLNNTVAETRNFTGKTMTSTEEFWQYNVLDISDGFYNIGGVRWQLAVSLLCAWTLVFFCLCKGVKSSGAAAYVTATAPYVLLTILLIRGATLPGAVDGVIYFITPRWEKLASFQVWLEAYLQVFYSLGPGWGALITMSSYNSFHNNCLRDAVVVSVADGVTSLFCGFVIFSVLGYMAFVTGRPVSEVTDSGPGLAFVTYPNIVTKLPISQLWAVLFFLVILFLGVDTQFGTFKTLCSGLFDSFPNTLGKRKTLSTLGLTIIAFSLNIMFVTRGGMYLLQIVDWYASPVALSLIALLETIGVIWIFGETRFLKAVSSMLVNTSQTTLKVLVYSLKYLIPVCMATAFIMTLTKLTPPTYEDYVYPIGALVFGWFVASLSIIPIPALMIWQVVKADGSLKERILGLLRMTEDCRPAHELKDRADLEAAQELEWIKVKEQEVEDTTKVYLVEKVPLENGTHETSKMLKDNSQC